MTVKDQNTKHSYKKTKGAAVREIHRPANGIWLVATKSKDRAGSEDADLREFGHPTCGTIN
jgi:hypothetical protein